MAVELKPQHRRSFNAAEARTPPPGPLTYDEFLDWADEDTYAEWVDGTVIMSSPASRPHQDLALFLARLTAEFVEHYDLGVVLPAPFQMKLTNVRRGREPDLLFVATENLPRLQNNFLDGPADLAVEIVSPESVARDREDKFAEYEAGGVREYWLLDPETPRADFFVRDANGRFAPAALDTNGAYHSTVLPGFWLCVGWLWQRPLPKLTNVLREWGLR